MKKKISLILIVVLCAALAISLAACNPRVDVGSTPDVIGPGGQDTPSAGTVASYSLDFRYTVANSFLKSVEIPYVLEDVVQYSVVSLDKNGSELSRTDWKGLTREYVDEDCKALLDEPGHHSIKVTVPLSGGDSVKGAFTLHLMRNAEVTKWVNVKFNIGRGAMASFGYNDGGLVTMQLSADLSTFASWAEFTAFFPVSRSGYKLTAYTYEVKNEEGDETIRSGELKDDSALEEKLFPFTVGAPDETVVFTAVWEEDLINVKFDLNLPQDATYPMDEEGNLVDGEGQPVYKHDQMVGNPVEWFESYYGGLKVASKRGRIPSPDKNDLDMFNGLTFGGWYTAKYTTDEQGNSVVERNADGTAVLDKAWNFNATVEDTDMTLFAKWNETTYSFTLYTKGGVFGEVPDIQGVPQGYTEITAQSIFLVTGAMTRIEFTGFKYNIPIDSYVVNLQLDSSGRTAYVYFKDLYTDFVSKGYMNKGSDYLVADGLYYDNACTRKIDIPSDASKSYMRANETAYVRWAFNKSDDPAVNSDRLSRWFTEMLFREEGAGYELKGDGSLRIKQCMDEDVNEIIIPASVTINGVEHPVTEIGDNAIDNMVSLTMLDLSGATNLQRIGAQAFLRCENLKEVRTESESGEDMLGALTFVGKEAFGGTPFENDYSKNNYGKQFIVFNKILYKYVGREDGDEHVFDTNIVLGDSYYGESGDNALTFPSEWDAERSRAMREMYNRTLACVETIVQGAFSLATRLETLQVHDNLVTIENGAFEGVKSIRQISVNDGSGVYDESSGRGYKLSYIGESAFDEDAAILGAESGNLVSGDSIVIGSIYYRLMDKTRETINISERILYVAPYAFKGATELTTITFADPESIRVIGQYAFIDTAFIRQESGVYQEEDGSYEHNTYVKDGYTVIGGKLVAHASNDVDLVMPTYGDISINANAFGVKSAFAQTLRFGANVKAIGAGAFYEAKNLKTIIMNEVDVDVEGKKLLGAPTIDGSAFLDANGNFIDGMRLFMRASVITFLSENSEEEVEDETTRQWLRLYRVNYDKFYTENIGSITVNADALSSTLLRTKASGEEGNAFLDLYAVTDGAYTDGKFTIPDALYVRSNTGIARYEALTDEMNFELIGIEGEDADFELYYFAFTYQDVRYVTYYASGYGDDGDEASDEVTATSSNFIFTVYKAIKADGDEAYRPFNSSDRYATEGSETPVVSQDVEGKNAWIAGVDRDEGTTGQGFVFWSTHATMDIEFHYVDVDGDEHVIKNVIGDSGAITTRNIRLLDADKKYIDYLPRTISGTNLTQRYKAYLEADFYGMGTVMFEFNYVVQRPLYNAIEQTSAISMALNADGTREFATHSIDLVRQDGARTSLALRSGANGLRFDADAINTRSVGINSLPVVYQSDQVVNASRTLTLDVYYIVTLEAHNDQFDYRITEEYDEVTQDAYGTDVYGEATITGVKQNSTLRNAETVVIPSTWTAPDGKTYKVSAIGENASASGGSSQAVGVFEGYTNLVSVYLSSNLEAIYCRAFKDCINLQDIYTAQKTTATGANKFAGDYDVVGEAYDVIEDGVAYKQTDVIIKAISKDMYEEVADNLAEGGSKRLELVINPIYDLDDNELGEHQRIRIVGVHADGLTLPKPDEISDEAGSYVPQINVYMPDTVAGKVLVYDYDGNVLDDDFGDVANLWFYAVDQYKFRVFERTNQDLGYIDNFVFEGCSSLDFIDLTASNVRYIGPGAFGRSGLKSIDLSATGIRVVNNDSFAGCANLESVILPDTLQAIGLSAFDGDKALTSVTQVGSEYIKINAIQLNAFNNCASLTSLKLDSEIESVVDSVFTGCNALTIYLNGVKNAKWGKDWNRLAAGVGLLTVPYVENAETNEIASDGYIYYVDESSSLRYRLNKESGEASLALQAYMIPQDIRVPAFVTYSDMHGLSKNYNVTEIGDSAFAGNDRLLSVTISSNNNLFYIRNRAFADCVNLQRFSFEESDDNNHLTSVDSTAFSNTPRIERAPDVAPNFSYEGFRFSITQNASIMSYMGVRQGGAYPTTIKIPESVVFNGRMYNVVGIDAGAFNTEAGHALTTVQFTQYIALISAYAFDGCSKLENIEFVDGAKPEQFTGVDMRAFSGTAISTAYVNSGDLLYRVQYGDDVDSSEATLIKYSGNSFDLTLPVTAQIERAKATDLSALDEFTTGTLEIPITTIFTTAFATSGKLMTLTVSRDVTIKEDDDNAEPDVTAITDQCYYRSETTGIIYEMFDNDDGDYSGEAHIYGYIDGLGQNTFILPDSIHFDGRDLNITVIHSGAFANVEELDALALNCAHLTRIEANAFAGCLSLTDIVLPAGVTQIDDTAFAGCTALTVYCNFAEDAVEGNWKNAVPVVFNFENGSGNKVATDGFMYATVSNLRYALKDGKAYVALQPYNFVAGTDNLEIPAKISVGEDIRTAENGEYTVEGINAFAFSGNSTLTNVTLHKELKTIGANAFDGSTLSNLFFSDENGLTEVDEHAFDNTVNITTVYYTKDGFLYEMTTSGLHNATVVRFFGEPIDNDGQKRVEVPAILVYLEADYTVVEVRSGAFKESGATLVVFNADTTIPEEELEGSDIKFGIVLDSVFYDLEAEVAAAMYMLDQEAETMIIASQVSFNGTVYAVRFGTDIQHIENVLNVEFAGSVTLDEGAFESVLAGKNVYFLDREYNVKYKFGDDGSMKASVVGFIDPVDDDLHIRAVISFSGKDYAVTSIDEGAFEGNEYLRRVFIECSTPASSDGRTPAIYYLTEIGARAFRNCVNVKEFKLEDGQQFAGRTLRKVGEQAMYGMSALDEVFTVWNDVLYKVIKSASKAIMLSYVGEGTEAVIEDVIDLGEGRVFAVTEIGPMSFDGSDIESITVYSDFEQVWGDLNVTIYYVANDVRYRLDAGEDGSYNAVVMGVDERAEAPVTALNILASITFDSNKYAVSEIADEAFKDSAIVTSVTIGDVDGAYNLKKIGARAFENLTGVTDIAIPNGVTYIGENAFAGCTALTIRCDFASDAASAFAEGWSGNCPVVYQGSETASDGRTYATVNGLRYALDLEGHTATLVRQSSALTGEVVITARITVNDAPYTVTAIEANAFSGIEGIEAVTLANSIATIGKQAFANCPALTYVSFNWSGIDRMDLHDIDDTAFENCELLLSWPAYTDNVLYWIDEQSGTAIYLRYFGEEEDVLFDSTEVNINGQAYTMSYVYGMAFAETVKSVTVEDSTGIVFIGELRDMTATVYYLQTDENGNSYKWQIAYEGEDKSEADAYLASYETTDEALDFTLPATIFFNNAEYSVVRVLENAFGDKTLASFSYYAPVVFDGSYGDAEIYFLDVAGGGKYRLDVASRTASVISLVDAENAAELLTIVGSASFDGDEYPVVIIVQEAFKGTNVVTVSVPASLKRIEDRAFMDCASLAAFIVPEDSALEFIAADAFEGSGLTEDRQPKVSEDKQVFYVDAENGVKYLLSSSQYTAVAVGFSTPEEGRTELVIISEFVHEGHTISVVGIGEGAFENDAALSSVTVAASVRRIEARAFAGTTALESFTYLGEEQLDFVSYDAFEGSALPAEQQPQGKESSAPEVEGPSSTPEEGPEEA